mmetsp:Transcript_8120/g.26649  ORF Transcript_8120/g.26649 Transcript_8120/m.26649 type:complete len:271 (+) Transcript_8120:72-884(+)|eukprot:CAMPEP_0118889444 /NCGR_PEP_ID=MMETSP1166-20130328/368_1 /TAXON_ID=1104430 /ORGANISM="Chrysoreinhardia sp, Strain CCMP3193" /LENGTH=270 /DNA_ID=CAMNT_0006828035 /DNA_START=56 /DNA_END=868 /DNA_ORIENTATION=+
MAASGLDQVILGVALVSSFGLSLVILVMTFSVPHYGDVTKDDKGYRIASDEYCEELYVTKVRPFRFLYDSKGPFSCPWPQENTVMRGILAIAALGTCATASYAVYKGQLVKLWYVAFFAAFSSAFWLAVGVLDADGLRSGDSLCKGDFKVARTSGSDDDFDLLPGTDDDDKGTKKKIECLPGPFAWLAFFDFLAVIAFAGAGFVWHRFSKEPDKKHTPFTALSDPFLSATQGPPDGGFDHSYTPVVSGIIDPSGGAAPQLQPQTGFSQMT